MASSGVLRGAAVRALLLVPALALLLVILILPAARLFSASLGDGSFDFAYYRAFLGDETIVRSFWTSLWLSVATTLLTVLLGYPLAYVLAVLAGRRSGILFLLVLLPFWTSISVRTFAFLILLGRQGPLNNLLVGLGLFAQPLPMLFTSLAVIVGLTHIGLPLMVLPLYAAMRQIDPSLMRVASSLGAGSLRAFWEVFLPLSLPGVAAGSTLVFMTTIGAYVIPALLGGTNENMTAQFIVNEVNVFKNLPLGAAITVGLLALTGLTLLAVNRFIGLERVWNTRGRVA